MNKILLGIAFVTFLAVIIFCVIKLLDSRGIISTPASAVKTIFDASLLTFKVWPSFLNGKNYYPESCSSNTFGSRVPDINKVSLAFSGGGARAAACTIGILRAIHKMGYKDRAEYICSCSGSGFLMGPYFYCEANSKISRDLILGNSSGLNTNNIPDPSNLKLNELENLNKLNKYYFGNILSNANILGLLYNYLIRKGPYDSIFSSIAGEIFLKPYNLNVDEPIALNFSHAEDIKSRNPNLKPIYCNTNSSFWLSVSSLFLSPFPYINIDMTPLYSGISQEVTYNSAKIGGVLSETFAFGNTDKPIILPTIKNVNCLNSTTYSLKKIYPVRTLKDIISTTSMAIAIALYEPKVLSPALALIIPESSKELLQKYNIWGQNYPLKPTTSDSQCSLNSTLGCNAISNYDPDTCKRTGLKCYSITAPSCQSSSDCEYSFSKLECVNKDSNKSSADCRTSPSFFKPFDCKCTATQKNYDAYKNARITDGGYSDLLSIIPLITRGVKNIICFATTDTGSDNDYLCNVKYLFGITNSNCHPELTANSEIKIFDSADFIKLARQFISTENSGGPVFARQKLRVYKNIQYGVSGGYDVDLLVILLNKRAKRFYDKLSSDIKNQITDLLVSPTKFNKFPLYSTFFQNIGKDIINLSLEQVNLLSTYCEWCLYQPELKVHIDDMFKKNKDYF